ncbi:hypothetical protein GCM10010910_01370 [Microbacterium nanhaiense]|uniref:Uncharacterized protein n=1 Tax=Microbacterium nanhaiense TaxID=1301026 RepID=A0ABQ2MW75_9MICO|nr:hypothetical protein [Microbacterium nanhaiense]GGO59131.1 hypothetical protein GCM10010910_01370 [Microbacterium nanhaiense]
MDLPASVPSVGTRRAVFIPGTVADIKAITPAEVTAGDNISCYLTRTGWNPALTENVINDPRYCSAQDFERRGTKSRTLSLTYTFNLNSPEDDVARLALPEGAVGVLVHFLQVDEDATTFAAGDWYEAVPVEMGVPTVVAGEDNAVDRITQKAFITGEWVSFQQLATA